MLFMGHYLNKNKYTTESWVVCVLSISNYFHVQEIEYQNFHVQVNEYSRIQREGKCRKKNNNVENK